MDRNRVFFSCVIPSVLAFALSGIYAIVDGLFIGNSVGDVGLSAINVVYPIMTMAEAGLGVSILAELVLRRTSYDVACLPIDPPIYRTLAVGYKDKDSLPIASKYFIHYLRENAGQLP